MLDKVLDIINREHALWDSKLKPEDMADFGIDDVERLIVDIRSKLRSEFAEGGIIKQLENLRAELRGVTDKVTIVTDGLVAKHAPSETMRHMVNVCVSLEEADEGIDKAIRWCASRATGVRPATVDSDDIPF